MVSTVEKKRDATIDIIKGFAMIAVVLLHVDFNFPKWHLLNVYSICGGLWHVAVFFVVSGWFLRDERLLDFKTFAKGKVINLYLKAMYVYIPFVLLHNVFLHFGLLSYNYDYGHGPAIDYSLSQIVYHIAGQFLLIQKEPYAGAMWFVDSLFLGLLLYAAITIAIARWFRTKGDRERMVARFIVCFSLAFLSATLRDAFGINLHKVSNTLSVLVLICAGQMLGGGGESKV